MMRHFIFFYFHLGAYVILWQPSYVSQWSRDTDRYQGQALACLGNYLDTL